jgi:hypothetical protein
MSNYTYHGTRDLIALPGRSVQTYPSGLVRVDRTYACQAADAGKYRQQFAVGSPLPFDDGAPSIDGAYVFPDAKEELQNSGFAQFSVSAYGRTNTKGTLIEGVIPSLYVQTVVISSSTPRESIESPISEETRLSNQLVFRSFPEVPENEQGIYRAYFTQRFFYTIFTIDRVNFGFWDECKIVWQRQVDGSVEYVREF